MFHLPPPRHCRFIPPTYHYRSPALSLHPPSLNHHHISIRRFPPPPPSSLPPLPPSSSLTIPATNRHRTGNVLIIWQMILYSTLHASVRRSRSNSCVIYTRNPG
ncbi:unnamed protein product [Lactuca virosa]|uniref:Uncharacterized protein n=1 Tax=Lactuca virosa TaxID=75947 RepID=A0AAU9PWL7_9ASTR|nr:unnamed protein product [Lactuca virosa]